MQFQIPQFIETEDKIVGPFTIRQFVYVAIAALASALLYFMVNTAIWFLLSAPIMTIGLSIAFVRINGQPLTKILLGAFNYYWKPQTYVWQPEHPQLKKTESAMKSLTGAGASLENLLSGIALHSAWRHVQTGSRAAGDVPQKAVRKLKERYEVLQRITGERKVARRVDYR